MQPETIFSDSVYKQVVYPNAGNLTPRGYFNLERVENLRVVNNGIIEYICKKYSQSKVEISKNLHVQPRTVYRWINSKRAIPFKSLLTLSKTVGLDKDDLIEKLNGAFLTYGKHHGNKRMVFVLKPSDFKLSKYLTPIEPDKAYLVTQAPKDIKNYILNNFSIDKYNLNKGLTIIYSYLLNRFLKTFYIYKKELLLKFPLCKEVVEWKSRGADITKSVIIPLLLADGGEKVDRLFISGNSEIIHDIFCDAFYYQFNKLPATYKYQQKTKISCVKKDENIMKILKSYCPLFKTSPVFETHKSYLKKKQPTIDFLSKSSKLEQQIALRLWFIMEGSVGFRLDKETNLIVPVLQLACAHPDLLKQLKEIAKNNSINLSVKSEEKNWSGLSGLAGGSINIGVEFLKMGGFIRGVKIKSGSKFFGGFDKQDVLLGIFEFMRLQREDKLYRYDNRLECNKKIREIVMTKQFKSEQFYIDYFEKRSYYVGRCYR